MTHTETPRGPEAAPRQILHVDMDAFYASVEQRDHPELRGLPVIVGGTPEGRGVVAAASYAARRFGVHSAMPAATARRLCPDAVFLPPRMAHYAAVSARIRAVFERYTPLVEPLSLDEAFLDVSASGRLFGDGPAIARAVKEDIRREEGLVASVGVAPNKFLAKIASDLEKPDGLVVVDPLQVQGFLDPLPVTRIWGVGRVAAARLADHGIHRIGELRRRPVALLERLFGQSGGHLAALARGEDARPVVPEHAAKSLSHETTFAADVAGRDMLEAMLLHLVEQVAARLRRQGLAARTGQLKLRYGDFRTVTRARSVRAPTDLTEDWWRVARGLLGATLRERADPVRLIGFGVSGLEAPAPAQASLFPESGRVRSREVDRLMDEVSARYGDAALRRARELRRG